MYDRAPRWPQYRDCVWPYWAVGQEDESSFVSIWLLVTSNAALSSPLPLAVMLSLRLLSLMSESDGGELHQSLFRTTGVESLVWECEAPGGDKCSCCSPTSVQGLCISRVLVAEVEPDLYFYAEWMQIVNCSLCERPPLFTALILVQWRVCISWQLHWQKWGLYAPLGLHGIGWKLMLQHFFFILQEWNLSFKMDN